MMVISLTIHKENLHIWVIVTDSLSFSIGLGHDGDNSCPNGVNIMSTALPGGAGALKWSSCSRDVLQGFLRFVMFKTSREVLCLH